ncbi:PBSX family phage terminase large subunit [Ruminococcus sp.]|uniref:PBSX family phage terminase large subunit n=1 Tax=Ruminococcus sp. TaxID=41978 RepID=UPI00260D6AFC|nr:PBSX family phage terminase large subunit [Ruminococcus sp.]MDD6988758.1 PBSX family phage terminase large subunit [Ruminococcus sp.]
MNTKVVKLSEVVGKGYSKFWNFKGRYRIAKGSRGSKKSKTAALWFISNIMKYPDANALVIRKTFNTLRTSVFTDLKWAIHKLGVDEYWNYTNSPLEMTYKPTGQKIYFRGLDDPLKITSISVDVGVLCWCWIEEFYEITKEEDFNFIDESIRGVVKPPLFKQITMTMNPWSEKHFAKRRFFDVADDNILAITTTYKCNEWLDEADLLMFEEMKKNRPSRYRVAGLGEWGIAEGLIFDNWHVEDLTDKIPQFDNVYNGLDFGYSADYTALIRAHLDKTNKKIYIFDEFYTLRSLTSQLVPVLKEKCGRQYIMCDSASPERIDELVLNGILAVSTNKTEINFGLNWLLDYQIIIHKDCVNLIREMSTYCWEEDKFGNQLPKPHGVDDHGIDALRYAFNAVMLTGNIKTMKRF